MYRLDLLKLDPVAHVLIAIVIALEVYTGFFRRPDAGVLQQIVRQHALDRDLLEATLAACSR